MTLTYVHHRRKMGKQLMQNPLIEQTNQDLVHKDIAPIQYVYIDLMCLKDFRLGALLSLMVDNMDNASYQIIQNNFEMYNTRMDRETVEYFPGIPYTEDDIDAQLQKPDQHDKLFIISPTTKFYETLHKMLTGIKVHNDRTDRSLPVTIAINIHPLVGSKLIKRQLMILLKRIAPNFQLALINKPLKYVEPSTLNNPLRGGLLFKLLFVWDIFDMLSTDGKLRNALTTDGILQNARIFGAKKLQLPISALPSTTNWEDNFKFIEEFYNIFCLFTYMDFGLPNPSKQDT